MYYYYLSKGFYHLKNEVIRIFHDLLVGMITGGVIFSHRSSLEIKSLCKKIKNKKLFF